MFEFFKKIFLFIKNYPGILYSLLLIVIIPLALYYNTLLSVKSFQKNIDFNLQTKALTAEEIFGVFAADFFPFPDILQGKIEDIARNNPEITKLRVISVKENGDFKVIASQDSQEIGGVILSPSFSLSWSQNQTIANLVSEKEERFWNVVKPIYDKKSGQKIGLVSMALSLKQSDILITRSIYHSYLIVIITIVLCLFLIIQHTRLFEYMVLSKKLKEVDKMKDDFIRMATHELQTPIANIRGYLELLREEIYSVLNDAQKKYFCITEISAKNLSDLVYDILEVSRVEQGRLDFASQKFSPVHLIREVTEELKIKAEQKNIKLVFKESPDLFFIQANPNRFRQVISNLVGNAIKYTKEGTVEITTEIDKSKNQCFIFVKDTGVGIAAEAQKKLFEKFYRVRNEATADIPGTGLGLWLAKNFCEKMNGQIFIESMEGVGSKFTVIFPLTK